MPPMMGMNQMNEMMNNPQNMQAMMQMHMQMGQMGQMGQMNPMQMQHMQAMMQMQQMQQMQQFNEPTPEDPSLRRDYFGEKLYTKISSFTQFGQFSDMFSKIVGIFLDLEEQVIERLISDDSYFDMQVRETIRLLADRQQN